MILRIDSIASSVSTFFQGEWWKKYSFHVVNSNTLAADKERFSKELFKLKIEIFDALNSSVFLGEYIESDNIVEKLESIKSGFKEIEIPMPADLDVQAFQQQEINSDFFETVESALNLYAHQALKIKKQFSFEKKEYILARAPFVKAFEEINTISMESRQLLEFFNDNLELAWMDHSLTPDPEHFHDLLELSDEINLERYGPNKFSKLFRDKCNFLKNKWITRKQHLKETAYYLFENVEKKADPAEFTNPLFSHWKDYILSHYEISTDWKSEIIEYFDQIKQKPLADCSLQEIHRLIKYYKDVNKNLDNLSAIVLDLNRRFEATKHPGYTKYDFQTHALALSYAMNNEFSLFLEDPARTQAEVDGFYKKILQLEALTGNYNYFPQFKYFGFLVKLLEKTYAERKTTLNFIDPAKEIIDKCKQVFERYRDNAKWSDKHYNYVFQLPYEECMVATGSNLLPKIFTASSFVLPLPKDKNQEEFEQAKERLNSLEASIDVYTNLKVDMQILKKVNEEVETMKKEVHNREVKSMEILGIFTAVVTFVLGSLPTFKFISTATQAFLFMFALATSLGFFVFLFFALNRGMETLKKSKWIIILSIFLVVVAWVSLIMCNKDPNVIQINRTEFEIQKPADSGLADRLKQALYPPESVKKTKVDTSIKLRPDSRK